MISRGEPSVGLMARRVMSQDSLETVLAIAGDVKELQNLVSEKRIDLRSVVTAWGDTPLAVLTCFSLWRPHADLFDSLQLQEIT